MHLPQDLQPHIAHATLVIVSDHIAAKIYLAGGDAIEEIDGVVEPRESVEHDDATSSVDGIRTANPHADASDAPRLKRFVSRLSESITKHTASHDVANIHLFMPADVLHLLKDTLPADVSKHIRTETAAMLMKEDILSVLRRVFTA